ncbi:hypothetical protein [Paraburkholderia aromaticivorans]|nr:hypothetical protein [Paraburkholderia aromaticivorans]
MAALTGCRRLDYGSVIRVPVLVGGDMARHGAALRQASVDNETVI